MDGMTADRLCNYVLVDVATHATAMLRARPFEGLTERHIVPLDVKKDFTTGQDLLRLGARGDSDGVIFLLEHGAPGRAMLKQVAALMAQGVKVYFYWPAERAIEVIDQERLASFWRLWFVTRVYSRYRAWRDKLRPVRAPRQQQQALGVSAAANTITYVGGPSPEHLAGVAAQVEQIVGEAVALRAHNQGGFDTLDDLAGRSTAYGAAPELGNQIRATAEYLRSAMLVLDRIEQTARSGVDSIRTMPAQTLVVATSQAQQAPMFAPYRAMGVAEAHDDVAALLQNARPVELKPTRAPSPEAPLNRPGMYLRLDFWAPLTSGGSYGHTVYQAKALSRTTHDFACVVANPFRTLDALGVRQVVMQPERRDGNETNIVDANRFYYERLRPLIEAMRPAFVFERLVLGNYVVAKICQELGIPYIAEYNGSEISMMRSFNNGKGYEHEDFYLTAEEFSFKQATLISVVSEHVGADVAKRGIPWSRILVNPNAVDLNAYAPAPAGEKRALRSELGFTEEHRVIGFIGTFGGWHGVDVLAASMHKILAGAPEARFLLIGDGNLKGQVIEAVRKHGIGDRVVDVGRVPQSEGARLLKACDILVSPHSSHMVDSKFFGSPTKLFEYMAMEAGIVASDLEQIGEVLAPALKLSDLRGGATADASRALMCRPGDVDDFVEATLALVRDPALSTTLGKNARAAAEKYYTWDQHVADLWAVLSGTQRRGFHADLAAKGIEKAI